MELNFCKTPHLVYVGKGTTVADVIKRIAELEAEIARLKKAS